MEISDEDMCRKIRETLTKSVEKRLMADVPFGVLLSGGLDSSLTSSIASKLVKEGKNKNWGQQLHSFSIGLEGAPDLMFAKKVADHLGTIHHEFHFIREEGIDAIRDVIYHLETYDVTTIRASTPMFLLSRKIKAELKWFFQVKGLMRFMVVISTFIMPLVRKYSTRNVVRGLKIFIILIV